ncbi:hypothetical protein HZS_5981, partial [Henneguya salminicola]
MIKFVKFYSFINIIFNIIVCEKGGNYISNLMKRMAPHSNNELPRGTQFFIKKHQLIKSTGIELEDDGQMIKLHPDLNGTKADLFPEYPLNINLQNIKLEIYLNSTISAQWSSKGSGFILSILCLALFCLSNKCYPVIIDDSSTFSGLLHNFSTINTFKNFNPYIEHYDAFFVFRQAKVEGTLLDLLNSHMKIDGKFRIYSDILCEESMSITRNSTQRYMFDSILEIQNICFNTIPSEILNILVPKTDIFEQIQKIKSESILMNEKAAKISIVHKFTRKCSSEGNYTRCQNDTSLVPDVVIYVWIESDINSLEPSIEIDITKLKTEIKSKKLSTLTEDFFDNVSAKNLSNPLKDIVKAFNLTESKKISISPDNDQFNIHFNSIDHENSCLNIGRMDICNWEGILKLFVKNGDRKRCSELNIKGLSTTMFDKTNMGIAEINIHPNCSDKNLPLYKMHIIVNERIVYRLFEYIGKHIDAHDNILKIFDMRNLLNIQSLFSERISDSLDEFLSEKIPNIIKGYTQLPELNGTIPFGLNIDTKEKTENAFKNLCLYLNKNSTLKFISKLTSMDQYNLPPMLEDSSVCIQPKSNSSLTKHNVHIRLPINVLSKCFSTDLLCPFLNIITGTSWKGLLFEGVLKGSSLSLKTPITPTGGLFSAFNLTFCIVQYKLKKQQTISIVMKCKIKFPELKIPIPIYFTPMFNEEELKIICIIKYSVKTYSDLFGIKQFKYKSLFSKFVLEEEIESLSFQVNSFYSEFGGVLSINQPPLTQLNINLVNKNKSYIYMVIPPYSIMEISKILGFGECQALSPIITDTLEEWEFHVYGLPFSSTNRSFTVVGLNLVQNSLFNSTIQVGGQIDTSRIILRGLKPIIMPIGDTTQQAVFTAYTDNREGPLIVLNMECACENICEENKIGDIIANIEFLGINTAIKINITSTLPWEGIIVSHSFMGQNLKTKLIIKLPSLEGPIEITGMILDVSKRIINKIQSKILKNAQYILNQMMESEKELDNILRVLNKIRTDKIDIELRLEEVKKKLEEDTTVEIVYETSVNLTCREEICERICIGCASTTNCALKDILGSCVSLSNWDMKCGCSRDPLCLLYNDACDEIIEMSKTQLKIYDMKKTSQKYLYENYMKKYEQISRDEAKTELLYSTAMKITLKTIKEMRHKLNEANSIEKDIPIMKWLKVSDIQISLNDLNNNETFNKTTRDDNSINNLYVFLKINYNDRKNKQIKKIIKYYPSLHGTIFDHVVEEISKNLFPNLYNVKSSQDSFSTKEIIGLDSGQILNDIKKKNSQNFENNKWITNSKVNEISRIRRSNMQDKYLRKIIHGIPYNIGNRYTLPKLFNNIAASKRSNNTGGFDSEDAAHWMIPHSTKGRCRVLLNILDILNDLLRTIHRLRSNHQKSVDFFTQGVDSYVKNLEDSLVDIDVTVMNEWRKSLSERIKQMGGKGIERFIQNLNDVIKTLLKPKSYSSLFSKIQKQNVEAILMMVKNIKYAILEEDLNNNVYSTLSL